MLNQPKYNLELEGPEINIKFYLKLSTFPKANN